jgi:hypothetical protein
VYLYDARLAHQGDARREGATETIGNVWAKVFHRC